METSKLFMVLLGCTPAGRFTEQHDIFFGIGGSLKDLLPAIRQFWPGPHRIHIDAWREVTEVDGNAVYISPKTGNAAQENLRLFFLNLGGYKAGEFEEFHYRMVVAAADKAGAVKQAKQTAFYKHAGFKGAESHIDDKYGVDVDDLYEIGDILPASMKEKYAIGVRRDPAAAKDEWHLGYTKLSSLEKGA